MFKKFINYLYLKYGSADVVSTTRKQLGLFNEPISLDDMSPERRELIYNACRGLGDDETLNFVMDRVVTSLKENMLTITEDKNLIYDRFSINGVALVKEQILALASNSGVGKGEYNQFDIV